MFVAGNVSPDARWGVVRGENRPPSNSPSHWSNSGSPPHWSNTAGSAVSREEKRHSSPMHPQHEDTLDSPPVAKRARQSHSRTLNNVVSRHQNCSRNKPYSVSATSVVNVPSCSSSRVKSPPPPEDETGYNSEDEYSHIGVNLTEEEWNEKDRRFERTMRRQGYLIKKMGEDGACLFRAIADQLFGDEEMHRCVRAQCMDYLESNRDYYEQYVTEPFEEYVTRKRFYQVHGNHLEIQAMSELYNRPIHIYCYSSEPINIFQCVSRNNHEIAVPLRLSYQRGIHYNSIVDPNNTSIGVGLGLPGLKPDLNKTDLLNLLSNNDNNLTEKQMLEDKIKFTDWEATNEAIEEHVARESYMLWMQNQEGIMKNPRISGGAQSQLSPRSASGGASSPKSSSTRPLGTTSPRPLGALSPRPLGPSSPRPLQATSTHLPQSTTSWPLQTNCPHPQNTPTGALSPQHHQGFNISSNIYSSSSLRPQTRAATASPRPLTGHISPKAGCSSQQDTSSGESPKPGSSRGVEAGCSSRIPNTTATASSSSSVDHGLGPGFHLRETASYLNGLPTDLLGLEDLDGDSILRRVMLESQQEYLNSLKRQARPDKDKTNGNS